MFKNVDPSFLIKYSNEFVVTKDLRLVNKSDYFGLKVMWLKFIGDLDVFQTSQMINLYIEDYLGDPNTNLHQLNQIQLGLKQLHNKFLHRKNEGSLQTSITKINKFIESRKKTELEIPKKSIATERSSSSSSKSEDSSSSSSKSAKNQTPAAHLPPSKAMPTISTPHEKKLGSSNIAAKTSQPADVNSKLPKRLVKQLSSIQDKINQLSPDNSHNLKKLSSEIIVDLNEFIKKNKDYKSEVQPIIKIMNILASKGNQAFKADFIQEYLSEKFDAKKKIDHKKPLEKWLETVQTKSTKRDEKAQTLLNNLPKMRANWLKMKDLYFKNQLSNLSKETREVALTFKKFVDSIQKDISEKYEFLLNARLKKFDDERFMEILKHYPSIDMEKNKDKILEEIMKQLVDSVDIESDNDSLITQGIEMLAQYFSLAIPKYEWIMRNQSNIKVAYEQSSDEDRNVAGGVCLQASVARYHLMLEKRDISYKELPVGGNEAVRVRQAKMIHTGKDWRKEAERSGYTIGPKSSKPYKIKKASHDEFAKVANQLIQLKEGQPLIAMLDMSTSSFGHVINIQVDPQHQKYRLIDDELGIIEFNSLKEFKKEFTLFLEVFCSGFDTFRIIIPG